MPPRKKINGPCSVFGCCDEARIKGKCKAHYHRDYARSKNKKKADRVFIPKPKSFFGAPVRIAYVPPPPIVSLGQDWKKTHPPVTLECDEFTHDPREGLKVTHVRRPR